MNKGDPLPLIYIVNTFRPGEMRQCEALAKALAFSMKTVHPEERPHTEPTLILSFGRALPAAMQLGELYAGRPKLIHFGRPRLVAPSKLDLIILMPQDDYPKCSNTVHLKMPLNGAQVAHLNFDETFPDAHNVTSIILGGPTCHFSFSISDAEALLLAARRLAEENNEHLHVLPGPRTPDNVISYFVSHLRNGRESLISLPLGDVLARSARLVVTSDSASLIADAWRSRRPTWIYPLPALTSTLKRLKVFSDRALPALRPTLIRKGWLAGGTDFARWHQWLIDSGKIRELTATADELRWQGGGSFRDDGDLIVCRDRVLALLR